MEKIKFVTSSIFNIYDLTKYYDASEQGNGASDEPMLNPMQRVTIRNIFSSTQEEKEADSVIDMDRCNVSFDQSGKMSISHGDIQTTLIRSDGGHIVASERIF
jgi:hypothetical protein